MGTSSLHIPLISGLGPGVWDGKVVLVGMSVFVTGIVVFVAAGVGVDETMFALAQEFWTKIRIHTTKRPKDRACGIFQMYHCLDHQVSLSRGDYILMSVHKPGAIFSPKGNIK